MKTVIAKAYLCFDALLEMIISLADSPARFTQTDLAEILGITLPTGTPTTINNVQYSDSLMDYINKSHFIETIRRNIP